MIVVAVFALVFLALWGTLFASIPWIAGGVRTRASRLAERLRGHARFGRAASRLEAHRSYLPLVIALGVGLLVAFATSWTFLAIAEALKENDPFARRLDTSVWDWCRAHRAPGESAVFVVVTTIGGAIGMSVVVVAVLAFLVSTHRHRWAGYLAVTAIGGVALDQLLKLHYARQRPDLSLAVLHAQGYSFPSGHAMGGTVVLGALAYLVARAAPTWTTKSAAVAGLLTFDLAVASSRLYLGVHWTTDVVAGLIAGLLWVTATTSGYEVVRQYRLRESRAALPA